MNFIDVLKKRRALRTTQAAIDRPEVVLDREQIDGYAKRAKDRLLANLSQLSSPAQRRLEQRMLEDRILDGAY